MEAMELLLLEANIALQEATVHGSTSLTKDGRRYVIVFHLERLRASSPSKYR